MPIIITAVCAIFGAIVGLINLTHGATFLQAYGTAIAAMIMLAAFFVAVRVNHR